MFERLNFLLGGSRLPFWLGQVSVDDRLNTSERAALVFSGPQFFVALVAGLVLAIAVQLVLTNLSVAAGISYLGRDSDGDSDSDDSGSLGGTIKKIGFAAGLWTLITVSVALFIACLLAVKLSLIASPGLGAIVGLVIWGAYFSLLVYVSSSKVGSLIGSVMNTANSGLQALMGTATAALGAKAVNDQVVSTAEAAAAAVRRELGSGLDPSSIRDSIEDYLEALKLPELDFGKIRGEFETLINDPELKAIAGSGSPMEVADRLRHIDRGTFANLVSNRTNLSKRDAQRLVEQLESTWKQVVGQFTQQRPDPTGELVAYLQSVQPAQVAAGDLSRRLDQLTEEVRRLGQTNSTPQIVTVPQSQGQEEASLLDRAVQLGFSTLMGTVMGRTDLSDLDVEKILKQLQGFKDKATDKAKEVAAQAPGSPFNTIKADVENYLLNTYSWHFNRATLETEFKDVLYDPEAAPSAIRKQLEQIDRGYFVEVLSRRNDLTPARVGEIADQMATIRATVLSTVQKADDQERSQDLRSRVENYLRSTGKGELSPEGIERDFKLLLDDREAGFDALKSRLSQFDRDTLVGLLSQRQDMTPEEADHAVAQLESTRDRVLGSAHEAQEQVKQRAQAVRDRVETYLRNTDKAELSPEGIQRDFQLLLEDPQAGASALGDRVSQFDRETLVALLSQRQDMTPEEADRVVGQVEDVLYKVRHAPQIAAGKAKEQYDQTTTAIAEYLRNTHKQELDPEGIQRDLSTLLHDPKAGAYALRERLSQFDRDTLVKLLSQREDLSEEQINQTIDHVQAAIRKIARSPRRLAARTKARVVDFQNTLEDYLRNTDKAALNPDGIKQDLSLMLSDPRTGIGNIGSRVAELDRSTIVALLAQRQDMTEEEANRIVDQVLSVRDQALAQIQKIQDKLQSVVDGIMARIRDYLNSLDRPELNYDNIKTDVRTLFYDPKAGFEALRDRLGSFNRDTLVAVLSSRDDLSEDDANRIIDQVEAARANVLRRADRIQEEAQRRLDQVKHQAQKQVKETQKAAANAAWWLFGTAITSGAAAAIAGAIAVQG
jgi:hypothetical protein